MTDIFISYSRRDKDFVARLHEALKQRDRSAWVDWEGIPLSAEWLKEIYGAIEAAQTFLFVISPHSVVSEICAKEIAHAASHHKRLLPVLRERVEDSAVPAPIRERNWLPFDDGEDFERAFSRLLTTVDTDLDWAKSHTRLLTRAIEWERNARDRSFDLRGNDLRRAETLIGDAGGSKEPRLTPLQIAYVLASRRDQGRRQKLLLGSAALAAIVLIVLGLSWWQKRQENGLVLARNLYEGALSALANHDPEEAEALSAHARAMDDRRETRELLFRARARSARLAATVATPNKGTGLAFSPDGTRYALAIGDTVEVWSLVRQARIAVLPGGGEALSAAFDADDTRLAVGHADAIDIWRLTDGAISGPELRLAEAHAPAALAFAPGAPLLASGGKDRAVLLWDLDAPARQTSRAPIARLSGHSDQIQSVAFSPDGRYLASGSWDNHVKIWDVAGRRELRTLIGHQDAVLSVAFSPDGKLVASGSWDNRIWLWDRDSGARLRALDGHLGGITTLDFSADGSWLASSSEDRTARLWEVETGLPVLALHARGGDVIGAAFLGPRSFKEGSFKEASSGEGSSGAESPGGLPSRALAVADGSGLLRLWDLDSIGKRSELATLRGHSAPVSAVAFSSDGSQLASASWDRTIRLWDRRRGKTVRLLLGHTDSILSVEFSPDGRLVASASKDGTVRLWPIDSDGGDMVVLREDGSSAPTMRDVAFSPDSRRLASAGDDGVVRIWNVAQGSLATRFTAHRDKVLSLVFSPDGSRLATAGEDGLIRLWSTADWRPERDLTGHTKTVWAVAFSPDGRYLASVSDDRTARLWDVESGREAVPPLLHDGSVWSVDFSPDGGLIAAGGQDSTVQLWRLAGSPGTLRAERDLSLHLCDGPVWGVRFNRDKNSPALAIASADKTVRIWSLAQAETMMAHPGSLEAEAERETGLQVEPDELGYRIVAIGPVRAAAIMDYSPSP